MTDYQTVIREVALKNRASIREDDILMVVVTVMNRIVEDQIQALTAGHERHRAISQETALAWRTDAAERANQILNVALDAGRTAMAKGMNEGGAKVVALIRDAAEAMLADMKAQAAGMERAAAAHRRFNLWMLAATCAGLLAALGIAALRYRARGNLATRAKFSSVIDAASKLAIPTVYQNEATKFISERPVREIRELSREFRKCVRAEDEKGIQRIISQLSTEQREGDWARIIAGRRPRRKRTEEELRREEAFKLRMKRKTENKKNRKDDDDSDLMQFC